MMRRTRGFRSVFTKRQYNPKLLVEYMELFKQITFEILGNWIQRSIDYHCFKLVKYRYSPYTYQRRRIIWSI